jgi:uncharacterized repeat protein (TIGR02543 family)
MSLLRFIVLFSFAALSIARAQCLDFNISANGTPMNVPSGPSSVSYPITIGEDLEFTVSPVGDDLLWIISGITVSDNPSYSPPIGLAATGNIPTIIALKVKNCGVEKTISLDLKLRTYTVTFDPNGGTAPIPPAQIIKHGDKALKPASPTPPSGYELDYWYKGSESAVFDFDTPIESNTFLKAKWKPKEYNISFSSNCPPTTVSPCPANPPTIKATYTKSIGTLPSGLSLADYDFKGWYSAASGGTEYKATTVYQTPSDITLYAQWEIKKYKVTFNLDGGTPAIPEQTVDYGKPVVKPADPTKPGYAFNIWEYAGTNYFLASPPVTSNITLKATWTPKNYIITFDPQGGIVSPSTHTVTYNSPVGGPLPVPTKTGYDFSGWYSAASGGTEYKATTVYQTPNDITLYARWTPKQYTITFNVNSPDGTVSPASKTVTYTLAVETLPTPTRPAFEFKGWFDAPSGGTEYTATTVYQITGPTMLYAKWEFIKGTKPKAEMLNFTIPSGLVYNGLPITSLPTASQKPGVYGTFGAITILYDGGSTLPKNAGTYAISAFIALHPSGDYDSTTVLLGSLTIAKAPATSSVISATAKSKTYDAKTLAEIENITLNISPLYGSDAISPSDYSISANFASPNVGTGVTVNGTVSWSLSGPLSKNYNISPSPLAFTTTANITQATGELHIIGWSSNYEYTKEHTNPAVEKSPFIPYEELTFEYKKIWSPDDDPDIDDGYSTYPPNRIGDWFVRATLGSTSNYTGAMDVMVFNVTRGNAKRVKHTIGFSEDGFAKDLDLSDTLRAYHVANLCEIKKTTITITIIGEPDIVLKQEKDIHRKEDSNGFPYYEINFEFGKPGLDTLTYALSSTDGIYSERDTLLIETPVPFEWVTRQKWNNVIFVSNNPLDNGGYEFKEFKWFRNDSLIDNSLQFYSAGSKSTDVLNPSDTYKVTMHTKNNIRISTCEGNPKMAAPKSEEKNTDTKQVLGINGKTAKPEQKVYNVYGAQRKNTPAGVYIVKDK